MKMQQEILSLLGINTISDDNDEREGKFEFCCPPVANDDVSRGSEIPLEILLDHIVPFVDRTTYNSCLLLCRRAREILVASWWKEQTASPWQQQQQHLPPWPRKLVSRDSSCRVRCLTFSEDNALLACGCVDGKIRSWDVRTGELPMPSKGHWPDEAVVALAYSNDNRSDRRLLASSSTDGTIRVWKFHANRKHPATTTACETIHVAIPKAASDAITTTTKRQKTSDVGDDNGDNTDSSSSVAASCILCIPSDHAVSLHFSPDDSYLVSGHLRMRTADDVRPTSTIEIRDVRTGLRLRRLEEAGVPVGFLASPPRPSSAPNRHGRRHRFRDPCFRNDEDAATTEEEEHRLISTCGPNTSLKLWSWNRTRCTTSDDDNEYYDPNILDFVGSNHVPSAEASEHAVAVPTNSTSNRNNHDRMGINEEKIALDGGRCIQQWYLDRFNTILPLPNATQRTNCDDRDTKNSNKNSDDSACDILVAVINEPSMDSFAVWNIRSPKDRKVFNNTSPYEIRFSPDGSKVASVDDFNTVKVWRISDGVLLKVFAGEDDNDVGSNKHRCHRYCGCQYSGYRGNTKIQYGEGNPMGTVVSYAEDDSSRSDDDGGGGLFPVHELVFSKDSSTVAVISRWYNEIHLFST